MGRPPCCDKVGIKKGPWTPEEDIILVTYIQEHGPGNWRSVPTNTGLLRCSKSCRLRWTNYLRPGIKRGNFTPHEEGMIVHLQALLGNKWAAIASYLPQRTDNDIKNYWNTHLKKKLKKFHSAMDPYLANGQSVKTSTHDPIVSKSFSERSSLELVNNASSPVSSLRHNQSSIYASSAENISRLLEGWMRSSPKVTHEENASRSNNNSIAQNSHITGSSAIMPNVDSSYQTKTELDGCDVVSHEELDSILSFDQNMDNVAWDKSTCDSLPCQGSEVEEDRYKKEKEKEQTVYETSKQLRPDRNDATSTPPPPLSFLEKWLFDENVALLEDMMELSPIF